MPFFLYDPTMVLLIPAVLFALWAQMKVKSAYRKYTQIRSAQGFSGAKVAESILRQNGIYDVKVEAVNGELSDHYDPRTKTVRLSEHNFQGNSLSALAIAAHEVGHAIQDKEAYAMLRLRHSILPVTNIASFAAFPLFLIGLFMSSPMLMDLGIFFFGAVVLFHLVTLPVEFNASSRAMAILKNNGYLVTQELDGAKKVLNAAALTYVAAASMALLNLVRLLILRGEE
ncbi:MAG: zinc metallopeptidase [Calditrichae bacterium]|nr:zinc metallopeptidase [Calditrichota bacterium]MCB9058698.1 zinc metallopeptidase [Calditrichia bacterium]